MKKMTCFNNPAFGQIRVIQADGKYLFCASDVAKSLGYKRPADAVTAHCKGSVIYRLPTAGGEQLAKLIPEGDVYRLIVHSKLPSAERFERWVFDEVLPSIRKHGAYITREKLWEVATSPEAMMKLCSDLLAEREENAALREENAMLEGKAPVGRKVLVVGGGGAGFSSAITAAQEGADVILIEKSSVLGGNTLMQGGAFNAVDTVAQSEVVLTEAQKGTLDSYLALSTDDPDLHFDQFPEWAEVLTQLQSDINQFYAENAGTTAGVDMPGFDSVALHMWHIYVGGLRQLNDGTWICSDIDLARNLAESALGTFEWMRDGLGLNAPSGEGAGSSLFTVLGAMWPRTHPVETSTELIDKLRSVAEAAGVTIYTETAATGLLTDDTGRVVGATAEQANGTKITINTTKGVVLASGGYCANPAMVKEYDKYWGDDLSDHTLTTNVGTNEGDGIIMAQAIGADVVGMEVAQMMPSSSPLKGTMTDGAWGDASEQIWIDGEGNRFVDEYAERDVLAKASLQLEDGIFYIIYAGTNRTSTGDTTVKGASLDDVMFGTTIQDMVDNGHVWYGDTLAELAEATATSAGGAAPAFTEEALRNTIEKYNSYVEAQEDPDFHKEVLAGAIDIEAIDADPNVGYVISPRKASLHHTMGGLKIDTEAQVINTEGEVIPGLWAAGEVTGGIHAGNRLGGNAVADIFTYGHIAGANAAAGN